MDTMPIADIVLWAFQDGIVCTEDGEAYTNIQTDEDVDKYLTQHESLAVFAAVMQSFGDQFDPKPKRSRATRKR